MIHVRGLTRHFKVKRRKTVEAVRGIDLDVAEGELVAFLGPNGAGKSTSLRMLTTLLQPTSGTAVVAGHDVVRAPAQVRRHIGYIGQASGAGYEQRVRDELISQAQAYGLRRAASRARADELLEMLDLKELRDRTVSSLSGGQRRRLDVAIGLVHRPRLLFLDEPSTGLDPHNRANLWEHVLRLREAHGMTLFLTTHYLDEADAMAERVYVIDHGRIIAEGSPERLKADLAGDLVTVTLRDPSHAPRAAAAATGRYSARQVEVDGATVRFRVADGDAVLAELVRTLDHDRVVVERADLRRPTLDDVFLHLTGRSLRESAPSPAPRSEEVAA